MSHRLRHNYLVIFYVVFSASLAAWAAQPSHPGNPSSYTGSYKIHIAGFYQGSGNLSVGAQSIHLNIDVKDEHGRTGKLNASNLTLENGRFLGVGTMLGQTVTLMGRVEQAEGGGKPPKASRIVCTFNVDGGHAGRFVGTRS